MILNPLLWIYWDPPRDIFTVPWINRPVAWYGFFFVLGFIIGYFIVVDIIKGLLRKLRHLSEKETSTEAVILTDRLLWFMLLGGIIGARLAHVFIYDWALYKNHPWDIFKIWEGGLASHGGAVGGLIALFLYKLSIRKKFPELSFIRLLDIVSIPTALIGCFIRIGNFFNQEILGTPTTVPWAVVFGHPFDHTASVPRHPVQLYEAAAYFLLFIFLWRLWKAKSDSLRPGIISGLFFMLLFTARFFIEFVKSPQSQVINESWLQAGQYLSIPFILLGILLITCSSKIQQKS